MITKLTGKQSYCGTNFLNTLKNIGISHVSSLVIKLSRVKNNGADQTANICNLVCKFVVSIDMQSGLQACCLLAKKSFCDTNQLYRTVRKVLNFKNT